MRFSSARTLKVTALSKKLRTETEVLAVDDVATTGNSILDAIKSMNGASVRRALVVLDREEGATEKLATHGIELASIFGKSDFGL
jgi:orotate phosphoribosyltransferase